MAAWGRVEGDAVGLPPKPGEDSALRPEERDSDKDSVTKEIRTQKKKILDVYCKTSDVKDCVQKDAVFGEVNDL